MKYLLHLRNLSLFFRALISIIQFGTRREVPKKPLQKVLVVQLAKLGDMVCVTPVLHALRKNLPNTKIYVLGNTINKQVLQGNSDFDEYIVFNRDDLSATIQYIKDEHIDVACIRGIGFIGLVIVLIAGVKMVITSQVVEGKGFETKTYRALLPYVRTIDLKFGEYMPRQFLRLLEPIGIFTDDTKKHLSFTESAYTKIERYLVQNNIDLKKDFVVGVAPSAGHKIKEWPEKYFAEVITYLISKDNVRVILIGGTEDTERVQNVIKQLNNPEAIINAQGQCTIDELKALISKLSLFMSVDTGPIYIAEAFGVPTIDITGPIDEKEQPPISDIHKVVIPPNRVRPQLFVMNSKGYDYREARRQAESITPQMVIEVFEELYPRII